MAITAAQIRTAVRNELYGADVTARPYESTLAANSLTADTTFDVAAGTGGAWDNGDLVEFEDGELCLVVSVSTDELTVIRSYGAVAAADRVTGDVIRKSPKFTVEQIDQAFEHVIQDLRPDIYELENVSLTFDPTTRWYPFDGASDDQIYEVIALYHKPTNEDHPSPLETWSYQRDVPSAGFTATHGLIIPNSVNLATGGTMYAYVKKSIEAVGDLKDDMKSMVVMGTVYHLLGAGDIRRIHDPGKRTDRTVQPGSEARISIWFLREYQRRKDRIASDLRAREGDMVKSRVGQRARRFRV